MPESLDVARYYSEKRGIPPQNICYLKTSTKEVINRQEYQEQIERPLVSFLNRWSGGLSVRLPEGTLNLRLGDKRPLYIVPTYGIPLKIAGYEAVKTMYLSSAASVDSELAMLPLRGKYVLVGSIPNPYFGADAPFGLPWNQAMYLVTRLDGPTAKTAKRLVDDAIWAEKNGLKGRAYFDARGFKAPKLKPGAPKRPPNGYLMGDIWIRNAYAACKRAGFTSVLDDKPEVMHLNFPMPDAAIYLGWYASNVVGPIAKPGFRFNRGAIAYHLHSFSAVTIRSAKKRWVGPLLSRGACVTMGTVYEPFLIGTPHLDIFMDRMLKGYNFAEAAHMSQKLMSWQSVFVGDPLYRPFAKRRANKAGPAAGK